MDRLYGDPSLRREMGSRGRQAMVERYDLKDILRQHEQVYQELLDSIHT